MDTPKTSELASDVVLDLMETAEYAEGFVAVLDNEQASSDSNPYASASTANTNWACGYADWGVVSGLIGNRTDFERKLILDSLPKTLAARFWAWHDNTPLSTVEALEVEQILASADSCRSVVQQHLEYALAASEKLTSQVAIERLTPQIVNALALSKVVDG